MMIHYKDNVGSWKLESQSTLDKFARSNLFNCIKSDKTLLVDTYMYLSEKYLLYTLIPYITLNYVIKYATFTCKLQFQLKILGTAYFAPVRTLFVFVTNTTNF